MALPLGHIAGMPVEETALALAPVWGGATLLIAVRARHWRRRIRRRAPSPGKRATKP